MSKDFRGATTCICSICMTLTSRHCRSNNRKLVLRWALRVREFGTVGMVELVQRRGRRPVDLFAVPIMSQMQSTNRHRAL